MTVYFAVTNFGITIGYLFIAVAVVPHIAVKRTWVRIAAVLLFLTGGITHGMMAVDALIGHHPITPLSQVNHTVQVLAVWGFVYGLYRQFVVGSARETDAHLEAIQDSLDDIQDERDAARNRADEAHEQGLTPGRAADAAAMNPPEDDEA